MEAALEIYSGLDGRDTLAVVSESQQRAADVLRALGTTADGMVAVAPGGCILSWNDSATALLGYMAEEVVGRLCCDVFGWLDRCGNPICSAFCPHCYPGDGEKRAETRDVIARSKDGRDVWLSVSTLVPAIDLQSECRLIHLFREAPLPATLERLVAERLGGNGKAVEVPPVVEGTSALKRLTSREQEVLRLVADGLATHDIANELTVSLATARNHVQHILEKLGVHSKLEAAVLYVRHCADSG